MKIQVTLEDYRSIIAEGLTLDLVFAMQMIDQNPANMVNPYLAGTTGVLHLRGYMENGLVTGKGRAILDHFAGKKKNEMISAEFVAELHKALQDKMVQLTGKKQKVLQEKYSFLCNKTDLGTKLNAMWKKYKDEATYNLGHVREALLRYVERCHRAGWDRVMLVEYYIMKNDTSKLATDLELAQDQKAVISQVGESQLVDPKTLF